MREYITTVSRYLIVLCMAFYTFDCFFVFHYQDEEDRKSIYMRQNFWMFVIQLTCFANLVIRTGNLEYLFFCAFVQVFLVAAVCLPGMVYPKVNRLLVNNMCMLLGIGFVMLSRLSYNRAFRQYIIVLASVCICMLIPWLIGKITFWEKMTWAYAATGVLALSIVLIMGRVTHGSKLSFSIAGVAFQPSEFVKILFVFFLAGALCEKRDLKRVALTSLLAGVHIIVLVVSRDLGSALIFFIAYVAMVFVAARNYLYLLAGAAGGSAASVLAYHLFSHVRIRVLAWQDPWSYIDDQGYQITQSLFAIGSGNWFGTGLYQGNPSAIPYVEADFIFSAICEELGTLFGICLILVILSSFVMMMEMAMRQKKMFFRLTAFGLGILYVFQIFLTIGGGIKFIPLTGVTLPFISYGGSSVLTTMIMFFILQGIQILPVKTAQGQKPKRGAAAAKEIMRCTYFFVGLFVIMMGYLGRFVATQDQEDLFNNSYNSRQKLLLEKNYRGTIYASGGEVLAQTIPGSEGADGDVRQYPYGSLFSHVVGYSTNGRLGIEALMNYYLINSNLNLSQKAANDSAGRRNPGNSVYTTLNVALQETASRSLGIYEGAIVVTDCQTGEILAMVSNPDFDPNTISRDWSLLVEDSESSVLLNRATQGLYPPGSTFKIVTALEYIREHPDSYENYVFSCNGHYTNAGNRINCYHGTQHGTVNFYTSFAKSCNSSFANIGVSLDRAGYLETLEGLLFNSQLPLELSHSRSTAEVTEEPDIYDVMQTSIGQGKTLITPMHLNLITCAIANDGVLMTPYVVDRVETADGKVIRRYGPEEYGALMTPEEASILQEMMEEVVLSGTATRLQGYGYTAAGKTGSAEYGTVKGESHAWFTGYAPAEDPQICVTIIIEGAGSGGEYAVPIARRIFDAWFSQE